jgi:hypothetical protein
MDTVDWTFGMSVNEKYRMFSTMIKCTQLLYYSGFAGVVPEYQCAVKRKEKKAQKDKDKPNSTTNGSPEVVVMKEPDPKV